MVTEYDGSYAIGGDCSWCSMMDDGGL
jgi:hypothetical protein